MTNFANHPRSIAEIKAEQAADGKLWTPRDALIDTLRRIDAGEISPDALAIVWRQPCDDDTDTTHFAQATPNGHTFLGLLEMAKASFFESD